jgi:hypothetical protein
MKTKHHADMTYAKSLRESVEALMRYYYAASEQYISGKYLHFAVQFE